MTTSWTTRAGGITLVALIAAAGCSSKTHPNSTGGSLATAPAASTPAVSSPAPATSAVASAGGSVAAPPASTAAPTNAATTSLSVAPTSAAVSLAGFKPASVTFVSASQGFVLGVVPCATGSCPVLASTSNAGATWAIRGAAPGAVTGPSPAISKVRFATKNDGWAFGPQLWSTHDGGRTWSHQEAPGPVSDVEASGGVAYVLDASCGTPPCIQGDRLLQTPVSTDGWTAISGPKLADGAGSLAPHLGTPSGSS